jgi:hypothetical protein
MIPSKARELGFTIDTHVYPWLAYKGARFSPTTIVKCYSEEEAEFLAKIEALEKEIEELKQLGIKKFSN